jgi:hypothetical protein
VNTPRLHLALWARVEPGAPSSWSLVFRRLPVLYVVSSPKPKRRSAGENGGQWPGVNILQHFGDFWVVGELPTNQHVVNI